MMNLMKKPTEFGKHPILMQRWDGSLRIIMPNGTVNHTDSNRLTFYNSDPTHELFSAYGCTSRGNQRVAYEACLEYDADCFRLAVEVDGRLGRQPSINYSAFLGYL